MSWLSRPIAPNGPGTGDPFTPSDYAHAVDLNNLAYDICTWGGNVNGGGYVLSNVILEGVTTAAAGAVTSVFGRTGDVVAQAGDYTAAQITGAVPNTIQVIAGAGLSGGGPLTANVTLAAAITSVFGRVGAVTLTPADISGAMGVVQSRKINTGAGLSGGGNLAGDLTLSVLPDSINEQVQVFAAGALLGTRHAINFISGANVTVSVVDNQGSNWIDVTISSTGGGGGMVDPTTSKGDLIVRSPSVPSRLSVGADGLVLIADSTQPLGIRWGAAGGGAVTSVFGRTGPVVAASGDYTAAQVLNAVSTAGSYADPAWITSLSWSKIQNPPAILIDPTTTKGDLLVHGTALSRLPVGADGTLLTADNSQTLGIKWAAPLVSSVFGRTGAVGATAGDYTAALVTNAVDASKSYNDPPWITGLNYSKLVGTPTAAQIGEFQTPWLQNINGAGYTLGNVSSLGIGGAASSTIPFMMDVSVGSGTMPFQYWNLNSAGMASMLLQNDKGSDLLLSMVGSQAGYLGTWANCAVVSSAGTGVPLVFGYNLTETMRITANGLGIGTTSPAYTLDINGDCNLAAGHVYRVGGVPISTGGGGTPAAPVNSVQFNSASAFGGSANLTYVSSRLNVTATGTTQRSGQVPIYIPRTATTMGGIAMTGVAVADPCIYAPIGGDDWCIGFDNGTALVERVRIQQSTGYVGIGQSSPSAPLNLVGSLLVQPGAPVNPPSGKFLRFYTDTAAASADILSYDITAGAYQPMQIRGNPVSFPAGPVTIGVSSTTNAPYDSNAKLFVHIGTNANFEVAPGVSVSGACCLQTANDAWNANTALEIRGNPTVFATGNVGMGGQVSPGYSLDVTGDVRCTSYLRVSGTGGIIWNDYNVGLTASDATWLRSINNCSLWMNSGNYGTNGAVGIGYGGWMPAAGCGSFSSKVSIGTQSFGPGPLTLQCNAYGLRLANGYGVDLYNDGGQFYILLTNSGDAYGGFNSFRPFYINLASGQCYINGAIPGSYNGPTQFATYPGRNYGTYTNTRGKPVWVTISVQLYNYQQVTIQVSGTEVVHLQDNDPNDWTMCTATFIVPTGAQYYVGQINNPTYPTTWTEWW